MKILVASDGSKNALRAVKYAADLLKNTLDKTKSITLISVHDDAGLRHAKAFVGKEAVADYLRELSEKELKPAMKVLNDQGIKHDMVMLVGNASQEIVAQGQKGKYDMIVLGSNIGSGLSTLLLSGNLTGIGRQLAFVQLATKVLGVVLLMPMLLLAQAAEARGGVSVLARLGGNMAEQVAVAFLILQVVSAVSAGLLSRVLIALAGRLYPPSVRDVLSKPHFIYEQALDEPETALDLVEQEQARLLGFLPRLLDPLRTAEVDGTPFQHKELLAACTNVASECAGFIDRLMSRAQSHGALERVMSVRARNELLVHMMDGCHDFVGWLAEDFPEPPARALRESLVEGLCTVLLVLSDAVQDGEHDYAIALALTSDRASVMEGIRAGFIGAERGLGPESQARLLSATSVFERVIWLANRYVIALDRQVSQPRPSLQLTRAV